MYYVHALVINFVSMHNVITINKFLEFLFIQKKEFISDNMVITAGRRTWFIESHVHIHTMSNKHVSLLYIIDRTI